MDRFEVPNTHTTLVVFERGSTELLNIQWGILRNSAAFWSLVERRVIGLASTRSARPQLLGTGWVGRAICDGIQIDCKEKVQGALLALLPESDAEFKLIDAPAPATDLGSSINLLVKIFLADVGTYVGSGRDWTYVNQQVESPFIAGKLNVPASILLRLRGLGHLVVSDRHRISHDTPMNLILYAALLEIENLAQLRLVHWSEIARARALSSFFYDSASAFSSRSQIDLLLAELVSEQSEESQDGVGQRMLLLAAAILSNQSVEPGLKNDSSVPVSWFVNLEALFERKVRVGIERALCGFAEVTSGSGHQRYIFPKDRTRRAVPDLVIQRRSRIVIGDVKYKDFIGEATVSASDIYQLLAHSASFLAEQAFLIFPGDKYRKISMGESSNGTTVAAFVLSMSDLNDSLKRLCADICALM